MKLTVIGRYQNPRCFKLAGRLPCTYKANKKEWMTSEMFLEFLTHLDRKMSSQNRNILLLLDQCAAHPNHLQPLDAGIIRNAKHYFKRLLMRHLLAKIERKDDNLQINLLDALHFIATAWDRVTPTTIANCFGKCGVLESAATASPESEDNIEEWEQLGLDCSADDFATCGLRTIDEIVNEAAPSHPEMASSDDDDDCSSSEQPPSTAEIMHALDIMRRSVASERVRESTSAQFFTFQASLMVDLAKKKVQKDIRYFFSRK
ncbi:tigger transposable element-derived protein 6 [Rhipicephalus sanguineus]|uniref:tigger transposable element-derived protein 6 n=1 Tax=Rhipicephalus sanguineus TaxID=34632 RepID=UPI0018958FA6|nr:tigger transposable element-derived protein 6 [Rhipicephalus sanguineus]